VSVVQVGCFTRRGADRSELQDAILVGPAILTVPTETPITLSFRRPAVAEVDGGAAPLVVAVLDGVGGEPGGHEASALSALILGDLAVDGPGRELDQIVSEVDGRICDLAGRLGDRSTMASTVAGIRIRPGGYEAVNVGDSRVYALHDGYLVQYSMDHARGGRLTQYLGGGRRNVDPYVAGFRPVDHGDLVLLCTDGLTRHLTADQIQRACLGPDPLEDLWSLSEGAADDTSVALVRWSESSTESDPGLLEGAPSGGVEGVPAEGVPVDDTHDGRGRWGVRGVRR
jgi:serine/threonine protein phosphatase PrpC